MEADMQSGWQVLKCKIVDFHVGCHSLAPLRDAAAWP